MIKLTDLIKEGQEEYKPYMYSQKGFGCHVCKFLNYNKDESRWTCSNSDYEDYMGTHYLIDPVTKEDVTDPKKYCSNWFIPKV